MTPNQIDEWVKDREQARKDKNFERADGIRNLLKRAGVTLEDRKDGSTRVKR